MSMLIIQYILIAVLTILEFFYLAALNLQILIIIMIVMKIIY